MKRNRLRANSWTVVYQLKSQELRHWGYRFIMIYSLVLIQEGDWDITTHHRNITDLVFTLTHWGRVAHSCVIELTIIGSNNCLSPGRHQAIIWTNAGILLIGTLGTKFGEILSEINTFSCMEMRLKMSSAKWRPYCLGLNVLTKSFAPNAIPMFLLMFHGKLLIFKQQGYHLYTLFNQYLAINITR